MKFYWSRSVSNNQSSTSVKRVRIEGFTLFPILLSSENFQLARTLPNVVHHTHHQGVDIRYRLPLLSLPFQPLVNLYNARALVSDACSVEKLCFARESNGVVTCDKARARHVVRATITSTYSHWHHASNCPLSPLQHMEIFMRKRQKYVNAIQLLFADRYMHVKQNIVDNTKQVLCTGTCHAVAHNFPNFWKQGVNWIDSQLGRL